MQMRRFVLGLAVLLAIAAAGFAQRFFRGRSEAPESDFPKIGEFHFLRMEYTDYMRRGFGFVSRRGRGGGWWAQDWPDADEHFTAGVQRLTRMNVGEPEHMAVTDDRIFDYPWIYATQTGYWQLSEAETTRLREYLMRGGFLVTDDFWGTEEYEIFRDTMQRVLPGKQIADIQLDDPVMHVLYDIQQKDLTFIPGTRHLAYAGPGHVVVRQPPGTSPAWQAIVDDKNRMVVAVNYNTDVGDAWEYADAPEYPADMTTLAYRYGINYLMYSITH
jgi:uncharacterized protein DUF4159